MYSKYRAGLENMSSLERFSEYRGFGLERFHCSCCVRLATSCCVRLAAGVCVRLATSCCARLAAGVCVRLATSCCARLAAGVCVRLATSCCARLAAGCCYAIYSTSTSGGAQIWLRSVFIRTTVNMRTYSITLSL